MARIFEADPTLPRPSEASPPYSEPVLPANPAPPSVVQTLRIRETYGTLNDWSKSPAGRRAMLQLCRYLIEILAFTFEADMAMLNRALGQVENTTTILSENEQASLLALSHLIRSIRSEVGKPEWLTVPESDCYIVVEAVSKPVRCLQLDETFVFRLLASYANHRCHPAQREMTLVAQRIPWLMRFRSVWGDRLLALGATVRSHLDVALLVAQDDGVRKLLGEAMIKWQGTRGLEDLIVEGRDNSDAYQFWNLAKAVKPQDAVCW